MNLSRFFIDRPIFAGVLSVLILLGGAISLGLLPISEYPEVAPPSVVVRASYPGASPKVIAETVATPIEEQINGVENMLYMSSQATTDGTMTLTVTFKIGTDPDLAQQLVQNRVNQAEPRLPEEVRRLGVTTVKSAVDLTMVVHLVSPSERYDMTYLRKGPPGAHRRRRPGADVGQRRLLDARVARSAQGGGAQPVRGRRGARHPPGKRAGRRRNDRRLAWR
jgi:multidrug efflux pump